MFFGLFYIWVGSAPGRVAELLETPHHSGGTMCEPVFEYEVDGRTYRKRRGVRETGCGWSSGEQLTIYFPHGAPQDGYPLTFFGLLPLLGGLILSTVLGFAAWVALSGRIRTLRERLEPVQVVALGRAPTGIYLGLEGNLQLLGRALRAPISGRPCVAWELT